MSVTVRETWTLLHGMIFGALFLLAYSGAIAELYSLRPNMVTPEGVVDRIGRLKLGTLVMAIVSWVTVIVGTYVVYPWYRDPAKTSPRSLLLANPSTAEWHELGMEWKEHIGWAAPILATAAAYVVWYFGKQLVDEEKARQAASVVFTLAFLTAAVAGVFGALITKASPVR